MAVLNSYVFSFGFPAIFTPRLVHDHMTVFQMWDRGFTELDTVSTSSNKRPNDHPTLCNQR